MNVSQKLHEINNEQNAWDDDITVTDIPPKHFPAVTAITPNGSTKDIRVDLMPISIETSSTQTVNSGLFIRQDGETSVTATVYQDGKEVASNTTSYPS